MKHLLKNFDASFFKKITSPKSSGDLNTFLEKLPSHTNKTLLVITGIAWAGAVLLGLYTTIQMRGFTELRAELQEMEAIKPSVPEIVNKPVSRENVASFVKDAEKTYTDIVMKANGSGIQMSASGTQYFGQFREAIGHVQNGGDGWRIIIDELCVGRECDKKPLEATLKINKIEVKEPT